MLKDFDTIRLLFQFYKNVTDNLFRYFKKCEQCLYIYVYI